MKKVLIIFFCLCIGCTYYLPQDSEYKVGDSSETLEKALGEPSLKIEKVTEKEKVEV